MEHMGEKMFAYEVDGHGNYYIMDDANLPSLLAMPYYGYTNATDEIYQRTRKTILSDANPWWSNVSRTIDCRLAVIFTYRTIFCNDRARWHLASAVRMSALDTFGRWH